ncbi:MAG: FluC/FEX family fluoride channel [Actinomycetota bacterium]
MTRDTSSLSSRRAALSAVAAGGALGGSARYGLLLAQPPAPGGFPWVTFTTNVVGCALIGVLMVLLTEAPAPPHPLVRPFLGVGLLGGFTTFSTYAMETHSLVADGSPQVAMVYLVATPVAAVGAVFVSSAGTRWVARLVERKAVEG